MALQIAKDPWGCSTELFGRHYWCSTAGPRNFPIICLLHPQLHTASWFPKSSFVDIIFWNRADGSMLSIREQSCAVFIVCVFVFQWFSFLRLLWFLFQCLICHNSPPHPTPVALFCRVSVPCPFSSDSQQMSHWAPWAGDALHLLSFFWVWSVLQWIGSLYGFSSHTKMHADSSLLTCTEDYFDSL